MYIKIPHDKIILFYAILSGLHAKNIESRKKITTILSCIYGNIYVPPPHTHPSIVSLGKWSVNLIQTNFLH